MTTPTATVVLRSVTTKRALLALAWPAALSYLLTNAYRINDQFWIQGLGEAAQSATGASMFVLIMNFALAFLAAGGTLSLVARATGARDPERVQTVSRHALGLALGLGTVLMVSAPRLVPVLVELLGLEGQTARYAEDYLGTLFLLAIPMFLVPALDNVFIGRGHTRVPMALQIVAITLNFVLNPLLIYGRGVTEAMPGVPGIELFQAVADAVGVDGMGMRGAAFATGVSRGVAVLLGLALVRFLFGTRLFVAPRTDWKLLRRIVTISAPVSLSIAMYAGVYWALLALVFRNLPDSARAGLGIGFQVFEGVSYPLFLGVGMACASLVGRCLGAGDPKAALRVVRNARVFGNWLGGGMVVAFLILARPAGSLFTVEPAVLGQVVLYVQILAISQYFVAVETIHEKVLIGAGETRSIPLVTGLGNGLRIPLGWLLATPFGLGAAGVYWAITATTVLKAGLYWRMVRAGRWLERTGRD